MLNYSNLNDVEFEYLCLDIMEKKLGVSLRRFATGKDGGIDLTDNVATKNIVVQVKHYVNSTTTSLVDSLKKELQKVQKLKPNKYFICCSRNLTPQNIADLYSHFSDYMESDKNIITLNEIESFLTAPENLDVLKKHFKLWIDSTGILDDLFSGDIFIDCEVLLSDIEKDKKLFVHTSAFSHALDCLSKNRTLLIVGNPGVGKTITSKMIVLNYAAEGYKVRYTTNGSDLASLKRSLSRNPLVKEIILVDDCFGQAYFEMKESQNTELLSLIKYVNMSKNKLLILNSRVTIFQEAQERKPDLVKSFDCGEYKVFVIDMTGISSLEKAKILYNHLAYSNIDPNYYGDIKTMRRYATIIEHPNYNPRVIEYISNPKRYKSIAPNEYYRFVMEHLKDSREIWKDEYDRRLQKTDRILLMTIYSLTDKLVPLSLVKKCFNLRISKETDIDLTINQFEASLNRLIDSFVKIVDVKGTKAISMLNPSVNDFLDNRLQENPVEKDILVNNAYTMQQLHRLLSEEQFISRIEQILSENSLSQICFANEEKRRAFVAFGISRTKICAVQYVEDILAYIQSPTNYTIPGRLRVDSHAILRDLLSDDLFVFYEIQNVLQSSNAIENLLNCFELEEMVDVIGQIHRHFSGPLWSDFVIQAKRSLSDAIDTFCEDIDADTYSPDVNAAFSFATYNDPDGGGVDLDEAASYIEDEIREQVIFDLEEMLKKLPAPLSDMADDMEFVNISISGAYDYAEAFLHTDDDGHKDFDWDERPEHTSEIDYIFMR